MKIPPQAMVIGVGALAVVGVLWYFRKQAAAAVQAVADVNKGTPYEGAGVVGTAGNIANQVSGGVLADIGSWLGGKVYDITHPTTLQSRKQAVGDNYYNQSPQVFQP
jgi:hypothetical protein